MQIKQLRRYALSLPGTSEEPHFNYSSFRVKGKIFATVPPDEKFAHIFVSDQQRELALALYPGVVETLLWGARAVGVRISLATAKTAFVQGLVQAAWVRKAPRALVDSLNTAA